MKKLRKLFAPKKTDGEKFLLNMQKQKIIVQAFYIAMGIALVCAFVKLMAFQATPRDIIAEELIFFVPLIFIAVRQIKSGLDTAKKISPKGNYPLLFLVSFFAGLLAAVFSFAAIWGYTALAGLSLDVVSVLLLAAGVAVFTALMLYILILLVIRNNKAEVSPAEAPPAQNGN